MKKLLLGAAIPLLLASCAIYSPEHRICRQWQHEGKVFSTIDSCKQCVYQLGDGRPEVVNGCALGIDAANLIELAQ
jgi:hypothetical protein